jgi:general secretion pathway protein J
MKRRAPNGFTLLELLLAIVLLSLITASIMGGVHLGRRAWESSRASEALDEVESAIRSTTGLIGRAYTVSVTQQFSSEPTPLFLGSGNGCRFVALSEGGAQWAGLILTEIGVEAGPEGSELVVWTKLFHQQEGLTAKRENMKRTVALKGLANFELAYFGAPQPGRPPVWSPSWEGRSGLPALVSVKLSANRLGRVIEAAATVAIRQQ